MFIFTLLFGLISWAVPTVRLFSKKFSLQQVILSMGFALLSLLTLIQAFNVSVEVQDWSGIMDVYPTTSVCSVILLVGVVLLNGLSWWLHKK